MNAEEATIPQGGSDNEDNYSHQTPDETSSDDYSDITDDADMSDDAEISDDAGVAEVAEDSDSVDLPECPVCFEKKEDADYYTQFECGYVYCNECLNQGLRLSFTNRALYPPNAAAIRHWKLTACNL
jgi:hypothetical protein